MKRIFFGLFAALTVTAYADSFGDIQGVKLIRVYDGDTFFVNIPGVHPLLGDEIGIRVRGIDTPEIRAKCDEEKKMAYEARRMAEDVLHGAARIDLVDVERGKYFRIVATVLADGVSLGTSLIDASLAVPYNGKGKTHDWCE